MSLKGRILFITGGSRGIGLEIGKRAAKDGVSKDKEESEKKMHDISKTITLEDLTNPEKNK